jgi:hypothetical protein
MKKLRDLDKQTTNLLTASDARIERFGIELDAKLGHINEKIDKVETWEFIDKVMNERIKEVNDNLSAKVKKNELKVEK